MRKVVGIALFFFSLTAAAQQETESKDSPYSAAVQSSAKKWSLTKYAGLSTGFGFFNGGTATIIAAPVGVQLNRKITNNLFAFAGVSVAPTYIGFTHQLLNASFKTNPLFVTRQGNNWVPVSRAEFGLMYINDEKTFSVSGSIGIQRGGYPLAPQQFLQPVQSNPAIRTLY